MRNDHGIDELIRLTRNKIRCGNHHIVPADIKPLYLLVAGQLLPMLIRSENRNFNTCVP